MVEQTRKQALTDAEAAEELGLAVATLRAWRLRGVGPRFVRLGRAVRYMRDDIDAYVKAQTVAPSAPREDLAARFDTIRADRDSWLENTCGCDGYLQEDRSRTAAWHVRGSTRKNSSQSGAVAAGAPRRRTEEEDQMTPLETRSFVLDGHRRERHPLPRTPWYN